MMVGTGRFRAPSLLRPGDKAMMVGASPPPPLSSEAMIVPGCLASLILLRSRCPRNFCRRAFALQAGRFPDQLRLSVVFSARS